MNAKESARACARTKDEEKSSLSLFYHLSPLPPREEGENSETEEMYIYIYIYMCEYVCDQKVYLYICMSEEEENNETEYKSTDCACVHLQASSNIGMKGNWFGKIICKALMS